MVGLSACAPSSQKEYITQCDLPDDQRATLTGKWYSAPVPISFQASAFSSSEMREMVEAAKTWNDFAGVSYGMPIIDYGDESNPRTSGARKPAQVCQTGIVSASGGSFSGSVVIYKQGVWTHTNTKAVALTSFCTSPVGKGPQGIYTAIVELNYQHFFVEGTKQPDLNSILVHEFGHMLGLDHSCNDRTKTGYPLCSSPSLPMDYYEAVMFPLVSFDPRTGVGERRRELQRNDQGRANCLYQDLRK